MNHNSTLQKIHQSLILSLVCGVRGGGDVRLGVGGWGGGVTKGKGEDVEDNSVGLMAESWMKSLEPKAG